MQSMWPLSVAGLWIHVHFLRIGIQLFFSMRIRIQQLKKCGSGSSLTKFVTNYFMECWNTVDQKDCYKFINNGVCPPFDSPWGEVCEKAPSVILCSHSSNHKNGQDAVSYCMYICTQKCSQDGVGTSPGSTKNIWNFFFFIPYLENKKVTKNVLFKIWISLSKT